MDIASRKTVAELLKQASVFTLQQRNIEEAFIQGSCDIELAHLNMDSLAVMEICIALEMNHGLALRPEDLIKMGTLGKLAIRLDEAST